MKSTPIFRKILIPLMILVIVEISLMAFAFFGQGLLDELNENERDVLAGRVGARKNYLQSVMINDWMSMSTTVQRVVTQAQTLIDKGRISIETLDDSSANCEELMANSAEYLIDMMRANRVTGAYIIINTDDLSGTLESGVWKDKPGLYLYDADPTSVPSEHNEDILIKLSPRSVVSRLHIATAANWDVQFRFEKAHKSFYEFLYYPFQTAYERRVTRWQDMGCWAASESFAQGGEAVLSYTVPLILENGAVIGVLGAELTWDYLEKLLPCSELDEDGVGAYFLAQYHEQDGTFSHVFGFGDMSGLTEAENGSFAVNEKTHYVHSVPLQIYNSNTPFSSQQWVLAGILPHRAMQSFARSLTLAMMIAVVFALVIGLLCSLLISYKLQRPVARLAQDMRAGDPGCEIRLAPTGILEIDQMAEEIMQLSRDVLESGRKFSEIISMASVRLSGYEIDLEKNSLFLTENFFSIFGLEDVQQRGMGARQFEEIMARLRAYELKEETSPGNIVLRIPVEGEQRFVRLRIMDTDGHIYGLAEDVTQSVLEKQIMQYERDHDSLTNLYNRRAFRRQIQTLLDDKENPIAVAALVMIDMDNLKYINDTYGHEFGDRYLKQAADAMARCVDKNACHARISGDEFNVFFYGYGDREEIEEKVRSLKRAINEGVLMLPDGKMQRARATGGVAWYPQDSTSFDDLSRYADYAMYRAKKTCKGEFRVFDKTLFESQDIQLRKNAALTRMIEDQALYYAFQPIVDAHTGVIFAYEALMRPDVGIYFTVMDAMDTARREGKLSQIEELTWVVGLRSFEDQIREGRIAPDCCLFINSIPTQRLTDEKERELIERYGHYGPRIVIELTEDERLDPSIWKDKERKHKALGGRVALDDYGAGYNSEKALLALSPDFIKVDLSIVRDIHLNPDKQAIMEYIVGFAHTRGKKVIAEGVETEEEVRAIVKLGADYLQGYFFAKPLREPEGVSRESVRLLMEIAEKA